MIFFQLDFDYGLHEMLLQWFHFQSFVERHRRVSNKHLKLFHSTNKKLSLPFIYKDLLLAESDSASSNEGCAGVPNTDDTTDTLSLTKVQSPEKCHSPNSVPAKNCDRLELYSEAGSSKVVSERKRMVREVSHDSTTSNSLVGKSVRFSTHLQQAHNQPLTRKKLEKVASISSEDSHHNCWLPFAGDNDLNMEAVSIGSYAGSTHSSTECLEDQTMSSSTVGIRSYLMIISRPI